MSERVLVDAREREKIRADLTTTLLVEAAAGTGKTSELVRRIVHVVETGAGRLSSLVAVTFTEKAAGEMKLRIRTELDRALSRFAADSVERERVKTALFELEAAKIGTIHALCADLLRAHPVESSVDPAFSVTDAERSRQLSRRAFEGFFEDALRDPPEGVRRVLSRAALDESTEDPKQALFVAASRLVETRDFDQPFRRDPLSREALVKDLLARFAPLVALAARARDGRDPLARALKTLARRLRNAEAASTDVVEATLHRLRRERDVWNRPGRGKSFADGLVRAEVVAQLGAAKEALDAASVRLSADLAACLSRELAPVITRYEALKQQEGALDFFDLLLRTRNLLRDVPAVRSELQERFTHLFVDEFQDTDPVQTEILLLLAADDPAVSDPFAARPRPGKLFLVGDPKQSIYRFRRADVTLYERVKRHLLAQGAELVQLSTSFRSLPALQSLVNATFEPLMRGDVERGQASYVRLSPFRATSEERPALVALPVPAPLGYSGKVTKKAINASLPDAVGAFLAWLLFRSGYQVPEDGKPVPLAARHVCLLFKRFRAFDGDVTRDYVRALEARRIPHVLSGGRAFHAREEVMAMRAVLHAIEWPDDALSVYATLRGPFVAFQDDVLLGFRALHGSLSPYCAQGLSPEGLGDAERAVWRVLTLLLRLHRARNRVPVASTLSRFLSELRAHAGVAIWPTGEQSLGNLYKLIELARSYERRLRGLSFRGFIRVLEESAEDGGAADASVVEESSDGVRIMTVHAAKGLEFPVVVLCDPTAPKRVEHASRYLDAEHRLWAQPLCDAEPIELYEKRAEVREQDEAEVIRLTYVAVTRARELLVVPVTGDAPIEGWLDVLSPGLFPAAEKRREPVRNGPNVPAFGKSSVVELPVGFENEASRFVAPGEHVPSQGEHRVVFWDPNLLDLGRRAQGGLMQEELLRADEAGRDARGVARYEAFEARREALCLAASAPSVRMQTVTEVSAAEETLETLYPVQIVDTGIDRSARPKGVRFGSLVHALLEHAPLTASVATLRPLALYLARSLAAPAAEVERAITHVEAALAHPLMERARRAELEEQLFRETPITTRDADDVLLDGVVDLAFRERDAEGTRMVLVDYKSDAVLLDLTAYARQLSRYAQAIAEALGEPVECVLFRV